MSEQVRPKPKRWVPILALTAIVLIVGGTQVRQWWETRGNISVAVLPFKGADVLRRTLTTFQHVRVIGPTTSELFPADEQGQAAFAERLAVEYLVSGNAYGVSLRKARGGNQIWKGQLDDVDGLLVAMGRQVNSPVKSALERNLPQTERARKAVIALDRLEGNAAQLLAEARVASDEALKLDNGQGDAHLARAVVLMLADHEWSKAEQELREALEIRPADALAARWYAHHLEANRKASDAADAMLRGLAVEPLAPEIAIPLAITYVNDKRWDLARDHLAQCDKEFPGNPAIPIARGYLARAQADFPGVIAAVEASIADERVRHLALPLAAEAHARLKNAAKARELLALIPDRTPSDLRGLVHWGLGEQDEFYRLLEKALEEKSPTLVLLQASPIFEPIQKNPRFAKILTVLEVKRD